MRKIKVVEVGPRDGLQNEKQKISLPQKLFLISELAHAGLQHIEVGAFVSPVWVPQMAESDKVIRRLYKKQQAGSLPKSLQFSALVPNPKGLELALKTPLKEIAIFGACSESFSKKNINCSIAESLERFRTVVAIARKHKLKVRGYLSTVFGCPYEGKVPVQRVVQLTQTLFKMGVYEVSLGDTIGVATPRQVKALLDRFTAEEKKKLAMHFHDTRGTALANVLRSLDAGITTFDSSLGSLGGCPYAQGASGNLATEDLIYMLEGMGFNTRIDLDRLIRLKSKMEKIIGRDLPSHVGKSGLPLQWKKILSTKA